MRYMGFRKNISEYVYKYIIISSKNHLTWPTNNLRGVMATSPGPSAVPLLGFAKFTTNGLPLLPSRGLVPFKPSIAASASAHFLNCTMAHPLLFWSGPLTNIIVSTSPNLENIGRRSCSCLLVGTWPTKSLGRPATACKGMKGISDRMDAAEPNWAAGIDISA